MKLKNQNAIHMQSNIKNVNLMQTRNKKKKKTKTMQWENKPKLKCTKKNN